MPQVSTTEITELEKKLQEIGDLRVDGNFVAEDAHILAGNDAANHLLHRCLAWAQLSLEKYVCPDPLTCSFASLTRWLSQEGRHPRELPGPL